MSGIINAQLILFLKTKLVFSTITMIITLFLKFLIQLVRKEACHIIPTALPLLSVS